MMVIVVEAVAATFPLPLVGLFVAYMGKMEVDDAGYISGYLVAAYFLGQVISGPIWGRLSDIIGRRAVLLAGLLISAQLSLVFGFSTTIPAAITVRFLQGLGNGNIVIAKTIVADVTDEWSESVGFAAISLFWSLGSILGPVIGGLLYDPATQDMIGSWWAWGPFWTTYPALLPCATASLCSVVAMVCIFFFLKETAPQPKGGASKSMSPDTRLGACIALCCKKSRAATTTEEREKYEHNSINLASATFTFSDAFRSKETRYAVMIYMALSAAENGTMEILPLWAIAPRSVGGLNFSSSTLGTLLMFSSVFCIGGNIMYGRVNAYLRSFRTFWDMSTMLWIVTLIIQPLASRIGSASSIMFYTTALSSVREVGISWAFSMSYASIARCAPKDHVGALNGIAQSSGSLSRMIFLVLLPPVFAYSLDSSIFNHHLAFVLCALPLALTLVLSRKLQFFNN
ncbi:MFS transporter, putative [Bodo saltans]|uniref:MFS transporter, putative n=1 Tax=Bodo saltans TaxID=75058 RepID=A0A0S4JEU3_BODSA|nr:MFS transporter, putative [Bodo saltans]|eukprot:CUG88972.1 MFS transporter, putative [Bodo saltans]